MDKTLLKDLKKKLFVRSALISLTSLDEILGLNDYLSGDEVLFEIIKRALREFEITLPLILEFPVVREQLGTCYGRPGWLEIKSNFTAYLKCLIPEHRIILVPNTTPSWRVGDSYSTNLSAGYYGGSSIPQPYSYQPFTAYDRPYLYVGDIGLMQGFGTDSIYIRGICNRPIIPDFTPDKKFNEASETSAIYWMDVENTAKGNYFIDLCLVHLLDYIRQMKASISLPNLSIDILNNVDSSYQELRSRCDQFALQSSWYGDLLI